MKQELQVVLPKLGESIVSATVVRWFKKEGDVVSLDEPLLEVSTDKVNSEIPAPFAGVLVKISAAIDQEIEVGALLGVIVSDEVVLKKEIKKEMESCTPSNEGMGNSVLSPAVLRLAAEKGISIDELMKMKGSGACGRVTKADIEQLSKPQEVVSLPPAGAEIEHVKMSGMRKAIADNMVRSFYEAPHASLVTEVDVTKIMTYLQERKEEFFATHGVKLTITSFVAEAMARALKAYPLLNASLQNDTIIVKRFVHLGIAVGVDQGVVVPVIRNTERLSLFEIAKEISSLSSKARSGTLSPSEVKEGTITLTNFGITGVEIGIPIIRYPEVAILGIGAVHKKVVVLPGDTMGIRSLMHLSLTFDHRVLDGLYGCGFLKEVKMLLENPALPSKV